MKQLLHLLIILSPLLLLPPVSFSASASASASGLVGGWRPIGDLKDPHVVEIAQFAVSEYNRRSQSHLLLETVVRGETQVVSGINYRLVLSAKDTDATKPYEAVVWEKAWLKSMNLTSFTPLPPL